MYEEIKRVLPKMRKGRKRVRTICRHFRQMEKYDYYSDIVILNNVINALDERGLPYSKNEVYSAFQEVDRDEYDEADRVTLLNNLTSNARKEAAFSGK